MCRSIVKNTVVVVLDGFIHMYMYASEAVCSQHTLRWNYRCMFGCLQVAIVG